MSNVHELGDGEQQSIPLNELVRQLLDMGYSREQAADSATQAMQRCSSVEAALEWIFNKESRSKERLQAPVKQLWNSAIQIFDGIVGRAWGWSASSLLPEVDVKRLCDKAKAILAEEETIHAVDAPVTLIGDIHGQFHDLLQMLDVMGPAPQTKYVFLGDYVDRGRFSVETIQFLIALKVRHPLRVTLLRGNHESAEMSGRFGFSREVIQKYGSAQVWRHLTELFNYLPLGCLIDNAFFCVHGGLSPDANTLDEIRSISRVQEVPASGPMVDLLWSDPSDSAGWKESPRGAGYLFGPDVSEKFNHANSLRLLCRAHEMVEDGYKWMHNEQVVTIFSAPNYGHLGNQGAAMTIDSASKCDFRKFDMCATPRTIGIERQLIESLLDDCDFDVGVPSMVDKQAVCDG